MPLGHGFTGKQKTIAFRQNNTSTASSTKSDADFLQASCNFAILPSHSDYCKTQEPSSKKQPLNRVILHRLAFAPGHSSRNANNLKIGVADRESKRQTTRKLRSLNEDGTCR
jgi:hypothetical protein